MTKNGFTLIELLVVISIMGLFGIGILLQQNTAKEDHVLISQAADIQSFIRAAQTNATTGVRCENSDQSPIWKVHFRKDGPLYYLDLQCVVPLGSPSVDSTQKTKTLDKNISIDFIRGYNCDASFPADDTKVSYVNLSSYPLYEGFPCPDNRWIALFLRNTTTNKTVLVTVEKGGAIDVRE